MERPHDDLPPSGSDINRPPRWVLPPTIFVIAAAAMALADWALPLLTLLAPPWTYAAALPGVLALGLAFWAFWHFKRARTPIEPFKVAHQLVTTGPYARTRNPMYTALLLLLVAWWLWLGSLSPILFIFLFPLAITRLFIRPEEAMLKDRFGTAFDAYAAKVGRWI